MWTYTAAHEIRGPGGKCLDVPNGRASSGTPVQLYTCNGTGAQRWSWSGDGPVISVGGLCLDVPGGATADGTRLQVHTCDGTPAQRCGSLGLGSTPTADRQLGTPGTYANWAWPAGTTSLTDVDFDIRVDVDPGPTSHVFWSNQFEIAPGFGGYIGMQSELDDRGRQFLFSVWGSTSAA